MEITLELTDKCIETAAEKEHDRLAKDLLEEKNQAKEKKLEFLREFLEKADFNDLRKAGFDGSEEMTVRVIEENGEFLVKKN